MRLFVALMALIALATGSMAQVSEEIVASPEIAASPEVSVETVAPRTPLGERPLVYRFDLHDAPIDPSTVFYFTRAYNRAKAAGADAIIIDIDTPGGRVDSCLQIRNMIFDSDIPTYAYVHAAISAGCLITLSTDGAIMDLGGTIGGSQPITSTGESMDEITNEKITSILRAEVRAMMEAQRDKDATRWEDDEEFEYQVRLAEAFITPPHEAITSYYNSPEVVCDEGELLTMTYREAIAERVAMGRAESLEEAVEAFGYEEPVIRTVQLTWSEDLARFLTSTGVVSILFLVALVGLWVEFKAPGFGVPGVIGLTALGLFFFGAYVADLSTILEPLMVITGVILIAIEIFVIPGFGFTGIAGVILFFLGLMMAMVRMPPSEFDFNMIYIRPALHALAYALLMMVVAAVVIGRWLPKSSIWQRLELEPSAINAPSAAVPLGAAITDSKKLVGLTGVAASDLRPAGTAEINGDPYDVVTQGEFIDEGTPIKVLQVIGTRIIVASED